MTRSSNKPDIDTKFDNHFRGTVTSYPIGSQPETTDFRLSDERPGPAENILPARTETFRAAGGQAITATLFNEGMSDLTFIHPGWSGDGEHALSRLQASQLVHQNPNTTFAYVNMPGMRGSEPLPSSVMKEMRRTGSFEPYGAELAPLLDTLRQDYNITKGAGWSVGGRALLGILAARHQESGLKEIVAIDPPGSLKLGLMGLMGRFALTEGGYAKSFESDKQTIAAKAQGTKGVEASKSSLTGTRQLLIDFPSAMSKEGLENDLLKATDGLDSSHSIRIVSPEYSALTDYQAVDKIMQRVSQHTDAQLVHYILDRQSHAGSMDHNMPLTAQLITDLLAHSSPTERG